VLDALPQYAIGKDAAAMKAVVGEEALSTEEKVRPCAPPSSPRLAR